MLNQRTQLDHLFQALADPTRRGIVEQLSRGPASVSKLAEPFAMSLPAVLQHLQVLEASGLVRSEKAGRVRTCRIERAALRTAEDWILQRARQLGATPRSAGHLPRRAGRAINSAEKIMSERSAHHTTFVIERTYPAPPARVFNAFADATAKARWFVGPDEWQRAHPAIIRASACWP